MEQNEITTSGAPNPLLTNDLLTNEQPSNVSHVPADIPDSSRPVAGSSSTVSVSVGASGVWHSSNVLWKERSCETQGCKNTVSSATPWSRCSTCSLKKWKARFRSNCNKSEDLSRATGSVLSKKRNAAEMIGAAEEIDGQATNLLLGWDSDLTEISSEETNNSEVEVDQVSTHWPRLLSLTQ